MAYQKSFWVRSISNWVYTSHLNTYNHTYGISIHWALDLCVICVDQVWTSLYSSMKLQWSIQLSHTQLVRSQVTYFTCRNEHIWPLTNMITIDWKPFALLPFYILLIKHNSIFEKQCHKHFEWTLTILPLALAPYNLV